MSKITSKLQVTIPKVIAERAGLKAGDDVDFVIAGEVVRLERPRKVLTDGSRSVRVELFDQATQRQANRVGLEISGGGLSADGPAMSSTIVPILIDTNVLVYRFDPRDPRKQKIAVELLRRGIVDDSARLPYQALIEFVAATTRTRANSKPLLEAVDARREVEDLLSQFTILYPNEQTVRLAVRGSAAYGLSWFDANIWAYAEYFGLTELVSEDFQDGRLYGSVRARDPFAVAAT